MAGANGNAEGDGMYTVTQPVEMVTVTWGREVFTPVRYQSVEIGPFSLTTVVRPGETVGAAFARAQAELEDLAAAAFEKKVREHLRRVVESASAASQR